ncbi:MAG: ABC transporter substrate-binding protein [Hyphomicrobiales bacterium]|nr:MAG: ABC transporter substrate-binding protein [Hyphomicrobiales bacterium]
MTLLSRRAFTLGTAGLAAATLLPRTAFAQGTTRTVTTPLGTYDIPASPQRVVAIDSRLDLQPALALGLPVVGHGHSVPGAWVPVPKDISFVGSIVNIEQVLALEPDLIICAAYDPDSEYWPLNKLKTIAPVLPTNGDVHWRDSLNELAGWLGLEGNADGAVAEYDALIAAIKARHGDKLQQKQVASTQPDGGGLWLMNGTTMLHNLVLTDLGANFVQPAAGQKYDNPTQITSENFATALEGVDGILLATTGTDEIDALNKEPLWQRLPAVAAGAVVASNGNVNYGSLYSARHLAGLYDELYSKIA